MPEAYTQNRTVKWFFVYHFPVIAYATIIILLSSIPNLNVPQFKFLFFDKLIHFLEYAVFALLTFRSFSHISPNITIRRAFILSILFLSLFATLDELYQRFIPGRHSNIYDLIGDILGALLVLAYLWVRLRLKK